MKPATGQRPRWQLRWPHLWERVKYRVKREGQHLWGAYDHWTRDDAALIAAAVAYYVGLSFFPVLLVLISGFGLFLRYTEPGQDAKEELLTVVATHLSQPMHDHIARALSLVQEGSTLTGPLGLIGILFAAMAGFVQFERAFDRIWGVPQTWPPGIIGAIRFLLIRRGVAFVLLLSFGLLIVIVFIAGLILSGIEQYTNNMITTPSLFWRWVRIGITLGLNMAMFTLLYRWLTKVKVRWREAFRGAALAAVLWEIGRELLAMFLVTTSYGNAYGVIGSFIAILLWCYYAVAVVFFGAEYIRQFCRGCDEAGPGGLRVRATANVEEKPTPAARE